MIFVKVGRTSASWQKVVQVLVKLYNYIKVVCFPVILPTLQVAVLPDFLYRCWKSIFLREHLPSIQQDLRRLPCRNPGVSKPRQPLWQPLHFRKTDNFFFQEPMGVWHFQYNYTNFWIIISRDFGERLKGNMYIWIRQKSIFTITTTNVHIKACIIISHRLGMNMLLKH